MSNLIQFRCPKCLKLLFKFDKVTGEPEYHVSQFDFYSDEQGNTRYVTCAKCKTECEITKTGLTVVTHKNVARHLIEAAPLNGPAKRR